MGLFFFIILLLSFCKKAFNWFRSASSTPILKCFSLFLLVVLSVGTGNVLYDLNVCSY